MKKTYLLAAVFILAGLGAHARCNEEQARAVELCEQTRKSNPACAGLGCGCLKTASATLQDVIGCLNASDNGQDIVGQLSSKLMEFRSLFLSVDEKEKRILAKNPGFAIQNIDVGIDGILWDALGDDIGGWTEAACKKAVRDFVNAKGDSAASRQERDLDAGLSMARSYESDFLDPELKRLGNADKQTFSTGELAAKALAKVNAELRANGYSLASSCEYYSVRGMDCRTDPSYSCRFTCDTSQLYCAIAYDGFGNIVATKAANGVADDEVGCRMIR